MAVEFSLAYRVKIANSIFGGAAFTPAESFTIKAYSNTISLTGTGGTEIDADGYTPIEIDNNTTNFPTATTVLPKTNAVEFFRDFEEAATIQSLGIFDQDNNFIARKVYGSPLEVEAGQKWRFVVGSISFNPANPS